MTKQSEKEYQKNYNDQFIMVRVRKDLYKQLNTLKKEYGCKNYTQIFEIMLERTTRKMIGIEVAPLKPLTIYQPEEDV